MILLLIKSHEDLLVQAAFYVVGWVLGYYWPYGFRHAGRTASCRT